jgi:hypothetical protein
MRAEVNIDTLSKINTFVAICSRLNDTIHLVDGKDYRVSAKSLMGAVATMDWNQVFVECDEDIRLYIRDFIVE